MAQAQGDIQKMLEALEHLQRHWALVLKNKSDSLEAVYEAVFAEGGKNLDFKDPDFEEKATRVYRWLQNEVLQYGEGLWLQRQACKRAEGLVVKLNDALKSKAPAAYFEHYQALLKVCQGLTIWPQLEQGLDLNFGPGPFCRGT